MLTDQETVQGYADQVHKTMSDLTIHMDANGAKMDDRAKILVSRLDLEVSTFLYAINLYGKNVGAIKWNGQTTLLIGVVMMLKRFMQQVKEHTGYTLKCTKQFSQ